ncbi:MAG: hypothetical protein AB7V27_13700 [Candidatus Binatia bacterium]
MRRVLQSIAALTLLVSRGAAEDLEAFLRAATDAARPIHTVQAEGVLTSRAAGTTTRQAIKMIKRPNGDLEVELPEGGVRALLTAGGAAWLRAGTAPPAPFARDAPLAGAEFTREDLEPFAAARFAAPTIVDRAAEEMTVSLQPKSSQYRLVVVTFDRHKRVPLKTLAYKDSVSSLVKMRRESGHVLIGGRWLPSEITIDHFPLRASSALSLRWSEAPDITARPLPPSR